MKLTEKFFYSIRNSYIVIKKIENRLEIINIRGWKGESTIFSLPCDQAEISSDFSKLIYSYNGNNHEIALYGKFGIILKGQTDISAKYYRQKDCANLPNSYEAISCMSNENAIFVNDYKNEGYLWVYPINGKANLFAKKDSSCSGYESISFEIHCDKDGYECKFITSYEMGNLRYIDDGETFESSVKKVKEDFALWQSRYQKIPTEWIYTMWVNFVGKQGILPTDSQVSGKMGMRALWSWDNLFSAVALAGKFDQKAFDLFMMPYRFLKDNGYMFDSITDDKINYSYTKPPVHGLAYAELMKASEFFNQKDVLQEVVVAMRKNTEYWLYNRAEEPFYIHGNDSTCDDATCFDKTKWVLSPDIFAFLSVQCETIANIYEKLGEKEQVKIFNDLSVKLAKRVEEFIVDEEMAVKDMQTQEYIKGKSLLLYRSFIVFDKLSDQAKNIFLSKIKQFESLYGFASEPVKSSQYNGSGYWRGAVWAPDQFLMYYALNKAGQCDYAREMALRYIEGIKVIGCYENIDGQQGKGNNCSLFSWTASVATWLYYQTLQEK